jgi:hypothetical protein
VGVGHRAGEAPVDEAQSGAGGAGFEGDLDGGGSGRHLDVGPLPAVGERTARAWAHGTGFKVNGKPVSSRGRLHPAVRQAWIDAGRPQV